MWKISIYQAPRDPRAWIRTHNLSISSLFLLPLNQDSRPSKDKFNGSFCQDYFVPSDT